MCCRNPQDFFFPEERIWQELLLWFCGSVCVFRGWSFTLQGPCFKEVLLSGTILFHKYIFCFQGVWFSKTWNEQCSEEITHCGQCSSCPGEHITKFVDSCLIPWVWFERTIFPLFFEDLCILFAKLLFEYSQAHCWENALLQYSWKTLKHFSFFSRLAG